MESEAAAVPGYLNRPHRRVREQPGRIASAGRDSGRRAGRRIAFVALRAYEQRAEHRARMRDWLVARQAAQTV